MKLKELQIKWTQEKDIGCISGSIPNLNSVLTYTIIEHYSFYDFNYTELIDGIQINLGKDYVIDILYLSEGTIDELTIKAKEICKNHAKTMIENYVNKFDWIIA